jgi:hypothetical protein
VSLLHSLRVRPCALLRRNAAEQELDDELAFHQVTESLRRTPDQRLRALDANMEFLGH